MEERTSNYLQRISDTVGGYWVLSVTVIIVHYHCHTICHTSDAPEASSGMQLDPLGITLHRAIVVVVEDVLNHQR